MSHCQFVEFVDRRLHFAEVVERIFAGAPVEGPVLSVVARENGCVTESPSAAAQRLLVQAADALLDAAAVGQRCRAGGVADARVSRWCGGWTGSRWMRWPALDRRGVFAEHGYKSAAAGVERPARLGAVRGPPPGDRRRAGHTADRAGRQRVAGAAARDRGGVRGGPDRAAARRGDRPGAGQQAGRAAVPGACGRVRRRSWPAKADQYTPTRAARSGARRWSSCWIRTASEPDDRPPARVNELFLTRLPGRRREGQGPVRRRRDVRRDRRGDRRPRHAADRATTTAAPGERQAEALADVCGYVLDHAPSSVLPDAGGHRPHLNVLIRLEDLREPGPRRRAWTSAARSRRSRCACCAATPPWCRSC